MRRFGAAGFAGALGIKLKERKSCNFSWNKAAFTLSAQSLFSPFFMRFLGFWTKKGEDEFLKFCAVYFFLSSSRLTKPMTIAITTAKIKP